MTFEILGLDHVVFRVRDIERSLAFYRDVLGCTLERSVEDMGLYQLRAGGSLIDLVPVDGALGRMGGAAPGGPDSGGGHNVDHVALRIAPFDEAALRAHLQAHGIAADEAARRYGAEGHGPSLYIEDPDGNTIELKGPPEE